MTHTTTISKREIAEAMAFGSWLPRLLTVIEAFTLEELHALNLDDDQLEFNIVPCSWCRGEGSYRGSGCAICGTWGRLPKWMAA